MRNIHNLNKREKDGYSSGLSTNPRICMFSQRHLHRLVSRCAPYEFEDVMREVDDVEFLMPEPPRSFVVRQALANRLSRYTSVGGFLNPGLRKLRLKRDYELFIALCQMPRDLFSINAIEGWKQRCRTSVCWIDEVWINELHECKGQLNILSNFDYVVLNCSASVQAVQDAIRRPCFYLPPGVNAIRFCPYPNPPFRSVYVYSMGRKSPVTHQALLKMAEQKQIFYIYDTIIRMETFYPEQHRILLANIAKRSRYFLANAAKIDCTSETKGQGEIGPRFFEGAASGTVMIGEHPDNDSFRKNFDWPDAVIRVPFGTADIAEILAELDSQPERLEQARRNNIVQSLLRHDWAYRFRAVLDMVGLEPKPALIAREERLKKLADDIIKSTSS